MPSFKQLRHPGRSSHRTGIDAERSVRPAAGAPAAAIGSPPRRYRITRYGQLKPQARAL
jgi:hypothetical protein